MFDVRKKPRIGADGARSLAAKHYGLDSVAIELTSERDQNFLLVGRDGLKHVLKIANPTYDPRVLALENQVLDHVGKKDPKLPIPRLLSSASGLTIVTEIGRNGLEYLARLITFLDGNPMALAKPHTPVLMLELGSMLARLDSAMAGLWSPVAQRPFTWSLYQAIGIMKEHASSLKNQKQRTIVDHFLARFEASVFHQLSGFTHGLIHNDANDHNILVRELDSGKLVISGLLDFGDLIWGPIIYEPAVAAAYAILDEPDPMTIAGNILAGYHEFSPMSRKEIVSYLELIAIRLCTSVVLAAHHRKLMPENEYLSISEKAAWEALYKLISLKPSRASEYFIKVCDPEPV
ncbi:MAG TPA: phosphotransferase [Patescibacteria group bacterium]|nr:phosphotransferase [Patescibacteria group bacterium]